MTHSLKRIAATCSVAAVVALSTFGAANANTFGPNGGGSGTGSVFCDHVGHRITFTFMAHPETRVEADASYTGISSAGLNTVVVPEWIEVAWYVKRAYGSWSFLGTDRAFLNAASSTTVSRFTLPATQGSYWVAGFYTRVAFPGSPWSRWVWEPATPSMSLSGSVAAEYGYCLT